MYDSPPKSTNEEDDDKANLLPSQKKKLKQKQRKAEARAKKVSSFSYFFCLLFISMKFIVMLCFFQEAEIKSEESSSSGVSKSGKRNVKPVDPDPHGEKLLQVIYFY